MTKTLTARNLMVTVTPRPDSLPFVMGSTAPVCGPLVSTGPMSGPVTGRPTPGAIGVRDALLMAESPDAALKDIFRPATRRDGHLPPPRDRPV